MSTIATASQDPTTSFPPRAALLDCACASPVAVAAKDKQAWLALFAEGASVLDPVGTPACRKGAHTLGPVGGPDDLARFYDCFIAPSTIRFEVHRDLVSGRSVVRDVTIHTTGRAGVPVAVPAHLVYTIDSALRIARLEAFWQSADVMRTVRRAGARGTAATVLNLWHLGRSFGAAGTRAYLRGVRDRVRTSVARDAVREWVDAVGAADRERAAALCDPGCEVELPVGGRQSIGKVLGGPLAGWSMAADKVLVCGWAASCSIHLRSGDRERHGVAVFELARPSPHVRAIRLYWDTDAS
jgi:hypothetical protein